MCIFFFLHNLIIFVIIGQGVSPTIFCPFLFLLLILCITYIDMIRMNTNNNKRKQTFFSGDVAVVIAKAPFSRKT